MITIFENAIKAFRWTVVNSSSHDLIVRITKKNTEARILPGSHPQSHRSITKHLAQTSRHFHFSERNPVPV